MWNNFNNCELLHDSLSLIRELPLHRQEQVLVVFRSMYGISLVNEETHVSWSSSPTHSKTRTPSLGAALCWDLGTWHRKSFSGWWWKPAAPPLPWTACQSCFSWPVRSAIWPRFRWISPPLSHSHDWIIISSESSTPEGTSWNLESNLARTGTFSKRFSLLDQS